MGRRLLAVAISRERRSVKKKPIAVQEFADVLTQADGSPIFSLLVTYEELQGIARIELSEQLVE